MDAIIGGAAGLIGGMAALVYLSIKQSLRKCEECSAPVPKAYKSKNRRQMLWGGWTCEQCGIELDRKGKKIEEY